MINKKHRQISVRRQSELLQLNRSTLYIKHKNKSVSSNLSNLIARIYTAHPVYGYRRIGAELAKCNVLVNHKKLLRMMREMKIKAIYPKPATSKGEANRVIYPYLLKGLVINRPHQIWQVDTTYLRTNHGFIYLVGMIDLCTRLLVGWRLSNNLSSESCLLALEDAIAVYGQPDIMNSDQGGQFTSNDWILALQSRRIKISMTGAGRCNDNANIERLWRSLKYEGSYLYKWQTVAELKTYLPRWVHWYNNQRPHQALAYQTPMEKYREFVTNKALPLGQNLADVDSREAAKFRPEFCC
jgi:putative transposase